MKGFAAASERTEASQHTIVFFVRAEWASSRKHRTVLSSPHTHYTHVLHPQYNISRLIQISSVCGTFTSSYHGQAMPSEILVRHSRLPPCLTIPLPPPHFPKHR